MSGISLDLARSEATVFFLSLTAAAAAFLPPPPRPPRLPRFDFSTVAAEVVVEAAVTAAPAFSLFIRRAVWMALKLLGSSLLSRAAVSCCWRICSAKNTPDNARAEK